MALAWQFNVMGKPVQKKMERAEAVTSAEVADWVRERIRRGRMVPGQRLVEADLVRETKASRTRVREALQRLGMEGLVTIEEFRGAYVKRFTRDELFAIYRTRAALEGLAAAEFAAHGSLVNKAGLQEIQQELDKAVHSGDHDIFARCNDDWHRQIVVGSGNDYVAQFVERLKIPVSRLLFSSFHNRQRLDEANAGHHKITTAIIDGDSERAEKLMRQHIEEGFSALVAQGIDD